MIKQIRQNQGYAFGRPFDTEVASASQKNGNGQDLRELGTVEKT